METHPNSGLTGPALDALLSPLDPGSYPDANRKLPHSLMIQEDAATAHRCAKAFAAVQVRAWSSSVACMLCCVLMI